MKLVIRPATTLDVVAAAQMKAAAWREAYTGIVPERELARLESADAVAATADSWAESMLERGTHFWLVVDRDADDEIVGIANALPARDDAAPALLELTLMYLRARAQGSGVADALLTYAIGDADCYLWVFDHNPRAAAFYAKHGFAFDGASKPAFDDGELRALRMVRRASEDD